MRHGLYTGDKTARHDALLLDHWQRFVEKWAGDASYEYGDYAFLEQLMDRDRLGVPQRAGAGKWNFRRP